MADTFLPDNKGRYVTATKESYRQGYAEAVAYFGSAARSVPLSGFAMSSSR